MGLVPGTRLGLYEIATQIGAGGMGEVYRARDTKLKRDVAVKVLPESLAADPERLARFQREAEVLAALNHPNIAAIYGLEDSTDTKALVMELVEGDTLADRIARGPIPVDEALPIAKQIAEALEAAHEQGIIHRDLKPANIKVRTDGTVKVLDFGLAKALDPAAASGVDPMHSPTITSPAMPFDWRSGHPEQGRGVTQAGMILGTAAYMAPEQARGRPVDKRADIWAFGCVLYEMLTGTRAFKGDDVTDIITSVMRDEPDWNALGPSTSFGITRLLKRCLTKDLRARLRDAGDLRIEIEEMLSGAATGTGAASASTPRRSAPQAAAIAAAVIVGAALAGAAAWYLKPAAADAPLRKFSIQAPDGGSILRAAISPDGQSVAYVVAGTLWVRRLDTLVAQEFPDTSDVNEVFWSPDSRMIGFEAKAQLWKVAATGGVPEVIGRVSRGFSAAGGAVWLPDDRIIFNNGNSGLLEISALGGEERPFLDVDAEKELDFHNVSALPDGRGYLFVPHTTSGAGAIDLFDGTTRRTVLKPEGGRFDHPVYAPSGHIVYGRDDGAIWAVPFALDRGEVTGQPFRVVANGSLPTVARDGTLTFVNENSGHDNMELAWVNARAELVEVVGAKGHWLDIPRNLPGTRQYVGGRFEGVERNADESTVWVVDSANRTERRLTYEPGINRYPVWSKDGTRVVYACAQGICSRPADGSGQPLVLVPGPAGRPELSHDDTVLLFIRDRKIYLVTLGASGVTSPPTAAPKRLLDTDRLELSMAVSPSGEYIAYESNDPGSSTIYITAFPSGRGRWPVGRGQLPHWSEKGDRLYFMGGNGIDAVDVTTTPALSLSEPRTVLTAPGVEFQHGWGMSADGSRFLVNRSASLDAGASVTVVQNWIAEFTSIGRRER